MAVVAQRKDSLERLAEEIQDARDITDQEQAVSAVEQTVSELVS